MGARAFADDHAATHAPARTRSRATLAFLAALAAAVLSALSVAAAPAAAQEEAKRVLIYTGTTGYRHADAIDAGRPAVQTALEGLGYDVDWEDCDNNGGGANNCDNPNKNPRIFTDANLANYDAIFLLNASAIWNGGGRPGPLWDQAQKDAIIRFVQQGGGIAANHNATDMGAGIVSWNWWDGGNDSAVGTLMKGHGATNQNNVAQVQVADQNHLSTRELPDQYGFGDEHYNFARSVRGTHHVLATLDERTYTPGNPMGQDHPISWCKLYDGDSVADGTGTPKEYDDGRVWLTGMGHFGTAYTANSEIVKHIVGGIRWAAGEGRKSDCSGTVWSNFTRTTLVDDVNGPIGLDVAPDGKVFWTEIGPVQGYQSEGYLKMYDPAGPADNKTTVAAIPTRADHGNSEDGVLGMTLENGFDLTDPAKRDVFIYYSPRNPAWPTTGDQVVVGYNQISRFTLNAAGTAFEPNSERVILHVPKAKISGNPAGFPGGPSNNGPGHVGGAGLDFDSDGDLYLGVGDDVSPNAAGHDRYPPMDYRAQERWDARKTSANSADLRGKVVRIHPLDDIPAGTEPGVDTTYSIPAGNMFPVGTAKTRPEIYAMGFRQPFTVQADPANPGTVVVGEYCHDNGANNATRAPAGVCEWNLVDGPGFMGWPFCVGDNSPANTTFRWNYEANATTNQQYDCSLANLPTDLKWQPAGATTPAAAPSFDGLDGVPGPAKPATVWKKYAGATGGQSAADFGDLSAGGMSPVTGPVYRYDADRAGPGAFPPYYDGSWFITNRGDSSGFWKEVRLRTDNNKMLRVNDWAPAAQGGSSPTNPIIPSRFGPDGALYMARWDNGCCRNELGPNSATQLVKIEFNVQDECLTDTLPPNTNHAIAGREHPSEEGTYLDEATFTVTAGDAGCAGLEGIEVRVNSDDDGDWEAYDAPLELGPGEYAIDYRATDEKGNVAGVKSATFTVVEVDDQDKPEVEAVVNGAEDSRGYYPTPASVTITATDVLTSIATIEYRVNQADEWQSETYDGDDLSRQLQVPFAEPGFQYLEYRTTDSAGNVSDAGTLSFSAATPCSYVRSDEFDGPLDARWLRHTRNGGTPTDGVMAPGVEGGQLIMPTHDQELDGATANANGPVNFLGLDLNSLGNEWTFETQFTIEHNGGWQHVGLIVWQADNNFFRSTITNSLSGGQIYVEQSKDQPTTTEGARVTGGGNVNILQANERGPVTIKMRYMRVAGSESVTAQYQVVSPAGKANADWVNFPATSSGWTSTGGLQLNPAGGARRDAPGSRIGIISAGNFPGSTGAYAYQGTPAEARIDYVRVTPDQEAACPEEDVTPPATTATLDPALPGEGGTYDQAVTVNLDATDTGEFASGVDVTEFSVDGGLWQQGDSVEVTEDGQHTVRYRSTDNDGNLEVAKAASFSIDKPNVVIKDIYAGGTTWNPDAITVPYGETVTWHWEEQGQAHNLGLIAPDTDPAEPQGGLTLVTPLAVPPGSPPTDYTFRKEGTWEFVCTLHSSFSPTTREWTGMVGTVDVEENTDPDTDAPHTTAALSPAQPGPGGTYTGDVTVTLTAEDADDAFPSGVTKTEYRVDGGAWVTSANTASAAAFATSFKVTAEGAHLVEYRSTDGEGNVEETQSVAFTIDEADQSGNPPGGNPPGGNPPGGNPPGGNPPGGNPPATAADLNTLPRTTLKKFRKKGLSITSACESGLSGKVQIALSRKQAKRIGSKKAVVLASKRVTCPAVDRISLRLKPTKKMAKKLKKAKKSLTATVRITIGSGSEKTSDSAKLVLKKK
jgi:plastocyanin